MTNAMSRASGTQKPLSVLYVTTALIAGGAEMMLYRLLSRLDRTRFTPQVVSLLEHGPISRKIQALGVPVRSLGMKVGVPNPAVVLRLARWLRQDPPDMMQTWMYHADLVGGLAARLAGNIPVAWGIRHSDLSSETSSRLTHLTVKTCALLSHWLPDRIVCCSEAARQVHMAIGYAAEKMVVIPNGYDVGTFRPDFGTRATIRKALGLSEDAPIIGMVARFDPQKDHRTFIRAAQLLHRDRPDAHFLLCGMEVTWDNQDLARWIDDAGLRTHCHLLGRRDDDIANVTAALDIASLSSSYGEGFPNVVSEAMCCGVPCVVTDVGDAALIVGQTGIVVPPRNPQALAAAWRTMLEMGCEGRRPMGIAARQRIKERFDIAEITGRYEHLFEELARSARA
jgi:glycosyltransferase involved in cell wall biosynthesis